MVNSTDFFCGLFSKRQTPQPTTNGLRGVEFSPRSSFASSRGPTPVQAPASEPTANLQSLELAGYYSPPAPRAQPRPNPTQELRGYYAPDPTVAQAPRAVPRNTLYL
ncbi:hypothetical protein F5B20DRAFT_536716 [Whalleya microplaca]|nr:hypothetical protein F5B20DRAFT_536716 [Whalleya microplaca]